MHKGLYNILQALTAFLTVGGLIGFVLELNLVGKFDGMVTAFLSVFIIGLIGYLVVRAVYNVTKNDNTIKDKTIRCPYCQSINDEDAVYCKKCGKKLKEEQK